jgi:hypothetical protein
MPSQPLRRAFAQFTGPVLVCNKLQLVQLPLNWWINPLVSAAPLHRESM